MIWLLLACSKTPGDTQDTSDTNDTADTGTDTGTPGAVGSYCDPAERIGEISVSRYGGEPSVSGVLYDKAHPWIGAPTLESDVCAFYEYSGAACEGCSPEQVCSDEGECVDAPRTVKDARVIVTVDGVDQTIEADALGYLYGNVGTASSSFGLRVEWPGHSVSMDPVPMTRGELGGSLSYEGDYDAPGELTLAWSDPGDESWVRTVIPINHHAGAPTFTQCAVPASAEGFVVPEDMVNPLAVITGLEFQSLIHEMPVAVETDAGCVQLWVGSYDFGVH